MATQIKREYIWILLNTWGPQLFNMLLKYVARRQAGRQAGRYLCENTMFTASMSTLHQHTSKSL